MVCIGCSTIHAIWVVIFSQVCFKRGQIEVYPDGIEKPSEGDGLNKTCHVTLYGVKPEGPNAYQQVTAVTACVDRVKNYDYCNL